MKRRLIGCLALSLLSATVMAQQPMPSSSGKRTSGTAEAPTARQAAPASTQQPTAPATQNRAPVAQQVAAVPAQPALTPDVPALSPEAMTPSLYLYLQDQKRHDDPAQAVRRKAEYKASQRMTRMASMKWFGMSNARPQAAAVPMMGIYSPAWIGNGYDRYDWVGGTYPSASIYLDVDSVTR